MTMSIDEALQIAKDAGFEVVAPMDPQKLTFMQDVRDMCEKNTCRQWGKKWTCPPACGTLEELEQRLLRYQEGVLFQTIAHMDGAFDYSGLEEAGKTLGAATTKLLDVLVARDEDIWPFGNDGCFNCAECTYPDEPCRFPERAYPSMEACGLMVMYVCRDNDVPYYYGEGTVAFTGGFLFNPKPE
ncbi:MAG: DUF2284 domain-containing protein [Coriobacteriales bacterium]|jgi:predicted metal-binding protein|nr:DUF2284 domain-containing protein [Coriobacteriales bacterium]